jgi:triosephosphate isomerase
MSATSGKKIFAANWKLNKTPEEVCQFVIQLKNEAFKISNFFETREILLFPSAFSLEALSSLCGGTAIGYGPQNVYFEKSGAFTGENSAQVAASLRSQFALVGHSERREIFKEQDEQLNKKNKLLQELSMTPVFCIGETLAQREAGETLKVCFSQIEAGLKDVKTDMRLIVAYEPVWAIGTGKVATSQQVAEVHAELYKKLTTMGFKNFQLLYGGSVKPDNAKELLGIPHVDGFLIGGASLQVESFLKICY